MYVHKIIFRFIDRKNNLFRDFSICHPTIFYKIILITLTSKTNICVFFQLSPPPSLLTFAIWQKIIIWFPDCNNSKSHSLQSIFQITWSQQLRNKLFWDFSVSTTTRTLKATHNVILLIPFSLPLLATFCKIIFGFCQKKSKIRYVVSCSFCDQTNFCFFIQDYQGLWK